ncbi:hypothetical protein AWB81_05834 [Caballeronia arationis]|nr:hypothetical protein AWB81_05834 [Caballeronia arationis]
MLAGDVVVQVGVERLVAQVEFRREREQDNVELCVFDAEARAEPGERAVGFDAGRERPGLRAKLGGRVAIAVGEPRAQQRVDLLVGNVDAPQLVERKFVARPQPQDFSLDEAVEPRQSGLLVDFQSGGDGVGAGHQIHSRSMRISSERASFRSDCPRNRMSRAIPVIAMRT